MEEEIIEYLKQVGATSPETGRTFGELMEATGRNYDTVWTSLRGMLNGRKAEVSDKARFRMNAPMPYDKEHTKIWRQENHFPIIVWLGPVIREEMEKRKREDDLLAALHAVAAKPTQVVGNQFNAPVSDLTTGPVVQQIGSVDSPIQQKVEVAEVESGTAFSRFMKRFGIPLVVTVVGGLLVTIFWEQIKNFF